MDERVLISKISADMSRVRVVPEKTKGVRNIGVLSMRNEECRV